LIVPQKNLITENELAQLARKYREKAGRTRAQAAREMRVSQTTIFNAEEQPGQSLLKMRIKMIQAYSPFKVIGPLFEVKRK